MINYLNQLKWAIPKYTSRRITKGEDKFQTIISCSNHNVHDVASTFAEVFTQLTNIARKAKADESFPGVGASAMFGGANKNVASDNGSVYAKKSGGVSLKPRTQSEIDASDNECNEEDTILFKGRKTSNAPAIATTPAILYAGSTVSNKTIKEEQNSVVLPSIETYEELKDEELASFLSGQIPKNGSILSSQDGCIYVRHSNTTSVQSREINGIRVPRSAGGHVNIATSKSSNSIDGLSQANSHDSRDAYPFRGNASTVGDEATLQDFANKLALNGSSSPTPSKLATSIAGQRSATKYKKSTATRVTRSSNPSSSISSLSLPSGLGALSRLDSNSKVRVKAKARDVNAGEKASGNTLVFNINLGDNVQVR
ncbi:MAG: hypothetical protein RLZZ210_1253 [Pseudomonadota bacterium]